MTEDPRPEFDESSADRYAAHEDYTSQLLAWQEREIGRLRKLVEDQSRQIMESGDHCTCGAWRPAKKR